MTTKDAINAIDTIQKRYESGESLFEITKEYHASYYGIKNALIKRGVTIRNKTEALQKYVRYNTCEICGTVFRAREKWNSGGNLDRKTCSIECEKQLRAKHSGWTEERKKHMSELFTGRINTWAPKGADKPNWKGGCSSSACRRIAFEEYKMEKKCEGCGSIKNLEVHHKDKNEINNTRENLKILCNKCHTAHHVKNGDSGWSIYNKRYVPKISVEQLKIELDKGKSIRGICKEYEIDHHTLDAMMTKHNITKPLKKVPITAEQVKQHLLEGKSVRWINREYNIASHILVPQIIKDNNIIVPNRKYMKPKKEA